MNITEIVLSNVSSFLTALLALFLAYLHLRKAIMFPYRRRSRYIRAANWLLFALVFIFVAICNMLGVHQVRSLLRVSFWFLVMAEIGYNLLWYDEVNHSDDR